MRIVIFGLGGACASDNRWFMLNYREFWQGLPPLNELKMTRYEEDLEFINGKADDLEISGFGFISFSLHGSRSPRITKRLTIYLPEIVRYRFRESILKDERVIHHKSVETKRFGLERVHREKQEKLSKSQKVRKQF